MNIWREDLSDFVPADVIDACTDFGTYERPRNPAPNTLLSWTLRRVPALRALLLRLRTATMTPPSISICYASADRASFRAKSLPNILPAKERYGITEVQGDNFAGEFHI